HRGRPEGAALGPRRFAHRDRVVLGVEIHHVERTAGRQTEAPLLPDGESRDAAVCAELLTGSIHDRPGAEHLGGLAAEKPAIVVVWDATDVLALGLAGRGQPQPGRRARARPTGVAR